MSAPKVKLPDIATSLMIPPVTVGVVPMATGAVGTLKLTTWRLPV